jgi:hypothetical protein
MLKYSNPEGFPVFNMFKNPENVLPVTMFKKKTKGNAV